MNYLIMLAVLYLMHLMLKLNWYATGILAVCFAVAVHFHQNKAKKSRLQERRFHDACSYMETLLYAFAKEGKIEASLSDVYHSLPEGEMRDTVGMALDHIHMTFDESEVASDAFGMIEQRYSCGRIRSIHEFLLNVESYGGEMYRPVTLLLEDKNHWESRINRTIQERRKMFRDVEISVAASLVICGMVLYLPVMNMDISSNLLVQILTVIVVCIDDAILFAAQRYLTADWLTIDVFDMTDDEKKMREYRNYDPKKERRLSVVLAAIAAVFVIVLLVLGKSWPAAIGMFVFLVCLNQHRIGHSLQRKNLIKSIKSAFPNWLMELVLLLQSENVQVALDKSRGHAPAVIRQELDDLVDRIGMSPEDSAPYHAFLKEFELPEVSSTMNMLYSLSVGNSGDADRQIAELIEKNQKMLDTAEAERMKDKNSGLYLLFLAPVLTASFKLVVDMAVFMLTFLSATAL